MRDEKYSCLYLTSMYYIYDNIFNVLWDKNELKYWNQFTIRQDKKQQIFWNTFKLENVVVLIQLEVMIFTHLNIILPRVSKEINNTLSAL